MSDIQSALEKARMVAAKITNQLPESMSSKRPADSNDDGSSKKFASVNDAVGAQLAMFKAQQLGGNSSEEIQVPDKLVGLIIGKGGDQIQRLQADTQCKVQIAADSNGSPDRVLTLTGSREAIERCKQTIDDVLKRGMNGMGLMNGGGGGIEVFEMRVPGNKCGLIIGKGGETIKRLSEQYGVKLVVVQETSTASMADKPLRITGEADKVARAKEAVFELLSPKDDRYGNGNYKTNEYGSRSDRNAGGSEVTIKVPGDKAGIVIGKGGESIKEINRRSGAHVEIDKNQRSVEGGDKMFMVRGTVEQIQFAQQLIYEKITGIQGSQPPVGFFGPGADLQYSASSRGAQSAYGQQQAQWAGTNYQQQWQHAADPKAAAGGADMAAWNAYYQQYYTPAAGAAVPAAGAAQAGVQAAAGATAQPTINPQTGQPDYSQAWVEYYKSLGMNNEAEAILRTTQTQTNGSSASSSGTPSSYQQQSGQQNGNSASNSYINPQGGSNGGSSQGNWPGYSNYQNYQQAGYTGSNSGQ